MSSMSTFSAFCIAAFGGHPGVLHLVPESFYAAGFGTLWRYEALNKNLAAKSLELPLDIML